MKPHTFQPARIGFFFREADGSVHATASYREETAGCAARSGKCPLERRAAPPSNDPAAATLPPGAGFRTEPAAEIVVGARNRSPCRRRSASRSVPPASPAPPHRDGRRRRPLARARRRRPAGSKVPGCERLVQPRLDGRRDWLRRLPGNCRRCLSDPADVAAARAGRHAVRRSAATRLRLLPPRLLRRLPYRPHWDSTPSIARDSCRSVGIALPPSVQHASDAVLEINEGGPQPTAIQLDAAHLQAGSFTYARTAEKVDVKLIVHQAKGPDFREVTSFLGKLPERKPVETPAAQKQREEAAKQAAKLKADLTLQAAKTKKLEKDLKSMRDEMRLQQIAPHEKSGRRQVGQASRPVIRHYPQSS